MPPQPEGQRSTTGVSEVSVDHHKTQAIKAKGKEVQDGLHQIRRGAEGLELFTKVPKTHNKIGGRSKSPVTIRDTGAGEAGSGGGTAPFPIPVEAMPRGDKSMNLANDQELYTKAEGAPPAAPRTPPKKAPTAVN